LSPTSDLKDGGWAERGATRQVGSVLPSAIRHQGPSSSRRVEGLQLTVTEVTGETSAMPAIVLVLLILVIILANTIKIPAK
jgi:hypothetical protein